MAISANSVCLSHEESICSSYFRPGIASYERIHGRRGLNYQSIVVLNFWPNSRKSRYVQLMRTHKNYHGIKLRCSHGFSGWTKKFSSFCRTGANVTKVASEEQCFCFLNVEITLPLFCFTFFWFFLFFFFFPLVILLQGKRSA